MPEKRPFQDHTVMGKFAVVAEDYQMTIRDRVVRADADPDSGAFTITLPPVDEAAGYLFTIVARDADGTNTVTVEDHEDDSECWKGDITLNGPCDECALYSDGLKWYRLALDQSFTGTTAAPTTG